MLSTSPASASAMGLIGGGFGGAPGATAAITVRQARMAASSVQ